MRSQEIKNALKKLGKLQLRPHQVDPIQNILNGHSTMCIFPTAAGKSLIYQVPTLVMNQLAVIITPLISLQQDQIQQLTQYNLVAGRITEFYSAVPQSAGFLFATPELLQQQHCIDFLTKVSNRLGFFVVDECHLIIEWGNTFRKAYKQLDVISKFNKPILALTASVTSTQAQKIIKELNLGAPQIYFTSFNRPNIHYSFHFTDNKFAILKNVISSFLASSPDNDSILIYAPTRSETDAIQSSLCSIQDIHSYHAGLSPEQREQTLQSWIQNTVKLIVCTTAFSLGIDKPSVGLVVHFGIPKSSEQFYQESGRGGRNQKQCYSIVLSSTDDVKFQLSNITKLAENGPKESFYYLLKIAYFNKCRRQLLMDYFNSGKITQKSDICCDYCDNQKQNNTFINKIFGWKSTSETEQDSISNQLTYFSTKRPSLSELCGGYNDKFPISNEQQQIDQFNVLSDIIVDHFSGTMEQEILLIDILKLKNYLLKKSPTIEKRNKITEKLIQLIMKNKQFNINQLMREALKLSM
ncbi:ATP-dependent DNA helicase [Spironucleus salmonicida]|uniref:DNA 3'-5' helicase n=1 Tax=Spironucleus salmonicida TaxID=348837 RepID=V6LVW0_9EUKA|nr:ATP-dependent DNA helicase [Spironucleus salmonicida]|eukprot:EST48700.1 ATP-dependent DNA helicase [Spironucleus salmonicida]